MVGGSVLDVSAKVCSPQVKVSSCAGFAFRGHVTSSTESHEGDIDLPHMPTE